MNESKKNFELSEDDLTAVAGGVTFEGYTWIMDKLDSQNIACPRCGFRTFTNGEANHNYVEIHAYEPNEKALITIKCSECEYKFMTYLTD